MEGHHRVSGIMKNSVLNSQHKKFINHLENKGQMHLYGAKISFGKYDTGNGILHPNINASLNNILNINEDLSKNQLVCENKSQLRRVK